MSEPDPSRSGDMPVGGGAPVRSVSSAQEDARLVRECLSASPGAWDVFVERFAGLFHHIVEQTCSRRRLSLSAADRDDVVAEILVEVLKGDAAAGRWWRTASATASRRATEGAARP